MNIFVTTHEFFYNVINIIGNNSFEFFATGSEFLATCLDSLLVDIFCQEHIFSSLEGEVCSLSDWE